MASLPTTAQNLFVTDGRCLLELIVVIVGLGTLLGTVGWFVSAKLLIAHTNQTTVPSRSPGR